MENIKEYQMLIDMKLKVLILVVSLLALTGCNNEEKKNEELLQRCYVLAEENAKQQIRDLVPVGVYTEEEIREKWGVDSMGFINQAGRVKCERIVEVHGKNWE